MNGHLSDAASKALLGAKIGEGSSRVVFAHAKHRDLVVKVSKKTPHSSNRTEWFIWGEVSEEPSLRPLLGSCDAISTSGRYLIMERLDDLTTEEERAKRRYPDWLTDIKGTAFGINRAGDVKIRDYGHVSLGQTLALASVLDLPPDAQMDAWVAALNQLDDD